MSYLKCMLSPILVWEVTSCILKHSLACWSSYGASREIGSCLSLKIYYSLFIFACIMHCLHCSSSLTVLPSKIIRSKVHQIPLYSLLLSLWVRAESVLLETAKFEFSFWIHGLIVALIFMVLFTHRWLEYIWTGIFPLLKLPVLFLWSKTSYSVIFYISLKNRIGIIWDRKIFHTFHSISSARKF